MELWSYGTRLFSLSMAPYLITCEGLAVNRCCYDVAGRRLPAVPVTVGSLRRQLLLGRDLNANDYMYLEDNPSSNFCSVLCYTLNPDMRSLPRTHRRLALRPARLLSTSASSPQPNIAPITSLLIANRGEIALRIHRTASRLGIPRRRSTPPSMPRASTRNARPAASLSRRTSTVTASSPWPARTESRLCTRATVSSPRMPASPARCENAGITFVGPPADAMAAMGDKARSKEIMTEAGVPCVPGYHGPEQGVEELRGHAREVGFPVLLKSVKGGRR